MPTPEEVGSLFRFGLSYAEIGRKFGVSKNVIAGICHRHKIRREQKPIISADEQAEREQDRRDLDILSDIDEGHSLQQTASHWGVDRDYVRRLVKHAKAAT